MEGLRVAAAVLLMVSAATAGRDFVAVDYLGDGEREVRLRIGHVHAKQTAMEQTTDNGLIGLHLWQVTDGRHFIQSIYTAQRELKDCEYIRRKDIIGKFLEHFEEDSERAELLAAGVAAPLTARPRDERAGAPLQQSMSNATFQLVDAVPAQYAEFIDYKAMKQACKAYHKVLKKIVHHKKHGDDQQKKDAEAFISRQKREISLIFPGTKWCGDGSEAQSRSQFGGFHTMDRCCRTHDHCPYFVPGLTERYGVFNFRLFTMSHCLCDRRFHTCLKMTGSGAAHMVGKIFFNVVRTKCFVLKKQVECVKSSWWGNECQKKRIVKRAALKNPLVY